MPRMLAFIAAVIVSQVSTALCEDSLRVRRIGSVDTPGRARGVAIRDTLALVADFEGGLRAINVSNPTSPFETSYCFSYNMTYCYAVELSGTYAYVADYEGGLRIVNIANPNSIYQEGHYVWGQATSVAYSDQTVYIGHAGGYLNRINAANPTAPYQVGLCEIPGGAHDIKLSGQYAYVATGIGLCRVNLAPFPDPVVDEFVPTSSTAWAVETYDHFAVVGTSAGLEIFDISGPPLSIGSLATSNDVRDVCVADDRVYLACLSAGLRVVNISNPAAPREIGFYVTPGEADGVVTANGVVYVADGYAGMGIYEYLDDLILSPDSFAFGLLDIGTDSTQLLLLFNPSGSAIPISSISLATPAFSFDTTGLNGQIAAHTTFQLPVTFAPTTTGSFADTLTIIAQQPGDSVIRVPLSGQAEILLPPVDSLVVQRGPQNGTLLYWAPVTHTITGQPFAPPYYIIYGGTSADGPFTPFGVSPTTSYHHPFIVGAQQKYFYQVTAASE